MSVCACVCMGVCVCVCVCVLALILRFGIQIVARRALFTRTLTHYLPLSLPCTQGGADVLALQEAVKGNDIRGMLDLIVRRQTPVDSDLGDGYTALTLCCCDGDAEAVSELLGLKANPQARERESGCTSLMMAAFNNHSDTIRVLLEHEQQARRVDTAEAVPSELQTQSMPSGETALYLACQEGHVDAVRALLEPKLGFNEVSEGTCLEL